MQQRTLKWLLFFGLFLGGCTSSPAAVSTNLSVPAMETAVASPVLLPETPEPLPATQTAVPTATTELNVTLAPLETSFAATPEPTATFAAYGVSQIIGSSAGGRSIESYRFGYGNQTIVLVGGMHGGYEWNTIVLAYEMIDYFLENPDRVPANISLYIVPSANPDGQFVVTGIDGRFTSADVAGSIERGRFNANQVDLNRNWACDWRTDAVWGNTVVSGGTASFSEPETAALRTFFLRENPEMVLFWHSKADGIYVGSCGGLYPPSKAVAEIYGRASGYTVYDQFTAYAVSGDASDWLATQNIPSFTVELKTRSQIDWSENLAGVLTLLDYYGR